MDRGIKRKQDETVIIDHGQLRGVGENDHHDKSHVHSGDGSGTVDHGSLSGLGDDDHSQYHNDSRGDARYPLKSLIDGKGEIPVGSGNDAWDNLAAGSDGAVLEARASETLGVRWVRRPVPYDIYVPSTTAAENEWTDMPSALTALFGASPSRWNRFSDLTYYSQVRLICQVTSAGSASAKLRGRYSTDDSTYGYFDGASQPSVAIATTGWKDSGWIDMNSGAKAEVYFGVFGIDGNAAADPRFGQITLLFR